MVTNIYKEIKNKIIDKYNNKARIILTTCEYKEINKKLKNNLNKCIKELKDLLNNEYKRII